MIRRSATDSGTSDSAVTSATNDDLPAMNRFRRALDLRALAAGATVGLAVLAAVVVIAAWVDAPSLGDDGSREGPLVEVLLSVAALGLVAAGAMAARRCRRAPLAHGAGAAVAAVVVAEVTVTIRQVASGDPIRGWAAAGWLLLGLACGLIGGLAVLRAPRLRRRADSPT
jgi:ribose/xylose/arabinose/galactoside ABC-type transport system permease subunit